MQNTNHQIIEAISLNYQKLSTDIINLPSPTVAALLTAQDGSTSLLRADNGQQYEKSEELSPVSTTYSSDMCKFV